MQETPAIKKQPRSLRDLIETVFRHRRKALSFFLTVMVATLIVLAFTPSSYTSTSKLLLRRGRENFIDPAAVGGEAALPLYKEWESEINSELEILNSRELIIQVINELGTAVFLEEPPPDDSGRLGKIRMALTPVRTFFRKNLSRLNADKSEQENNEQQQKLDSVIQILEKNLQINARTKSDIIYVTYTAPSPELARQVVTVLVNKYLERRLDLHRIPGAHQFFSQQSDILLSELEEYEDRIANLKNEAAISELDTDRVALRTTIEEMRTEQLKVQAELAASEARVQSIRSMLSQQSSTPNSRSSVLDPVEYKELQTTLRIEEFTFSALTAENNEITDQLAELQKEMVRIKTMESPIRNLQREQDLLEEKYKKYAENREQARINQELETRKISNVTIVQQATTPERENPSGKVLKLMAALVLGFIGAIAIAFGADYMDPTLHTSADVSDHLAMPTLIELPKMIPRTLDPANKPPPRKKRRGLSILSGITAQRDENDSFQELYFHLLNLSPEKGNRPLVIGITSSIGGEGVSTIAGKLATAFTCDERFPSVLLLDANLVEHSMQQIKRRTDLPFTFQQVRDDAGPEGDDTAVPNAGTLLKHLHRIRQEHYDIVIVDLPPLNEGAYSARAAEVTDITALVVDSGRTPWRTVEWATDLLKSSGANLCGIILNRQQYTMPKWLYKRL